MNKKEKSDIDSEVSRLQLEVNDMMETKMAHEKFKGQVDELSQLMQLSQLSQLSDEDKKLQEFQEIYLKLEKNKFDLELLKQRRKELLEASSKSNDPFLEPKIDTHHQLMMDAQTAYTQTYGFYKETAESQFIKLLDEYLTNDMSHSTFKFCVNQFLEADKLFKNKYEPYLFATTEPEIAKSIQEYFKDFLINDGNMSTFKYSLAQVDKVISISAPAKYELSEIVRVLDTDNYKALFDKCDTHLNKLKTQFLKRKMSESTFNFCHEQIKYARKTIESLADSTLFKSIDFNFSNRHMKVQIHENCRTPEFIDGMKHVKIPGGVRIELSPERQLGLRATKPIKASSDKSSSSQGVMAKIRKMLITVLNQCLTYLQTSPQENNKEAVIQEEKELIENSTPTNRMLATRAYAEIRLQLDDTADIAHAPKLQSIIEQIHHILESDNLYDSLAPESRVNLEKIYPDVLQSIVSQCEKDSENFRLTGQNDKLLPEVIESFNEKISHIIEYKVEQDQKDTKIMHRYLKAKA